VAPLAQLWNLPPVVGFTFNAVRQQVAHHCVPRLRWKARAWRSRRQHAQGAAHACPNETGTFKPEAELLETSTGDTGVEIDTAHPKS